MQNRPKIGIENWGTHKILTNNIPCKAPKIKMKSQKREGFEIKLTNVNKSERSQEALN